MKNNKRKVMISFEKLPQAIRDQLKKEYPDGFQEYLVCITDHKNNALHVLRYETEESSYLIKMDNYRAHIANFLSENGEAPSQNSLT